jgi:hypothetical protein
MTAGATPPAGPGIANRIGSGMMWGAGLGMAALLAAHYFYEPPTPPAQEGDAPAAVPAAVPAPAQPTAAEKTEPSTAPAPDRQRPLPPSSVRPFEPPQTDPTGEPPRL